MDNETWQRVIREIEEEFPTFRLVFKDRSRLMKAIDVFLKVITLWRMRAFMTSFTTTIGYTVYVARSSWDSMSPEGRAAVLRHERVHMRQRRKYGMVLYTFLYLLFPLPGGLAYFRAKFEKEAYEETIRAAVDYGWDVSDPGFRSRMVSHFTGPEYFWMWPFRKSVEAWYDAAVVRSTTV